MSEVSSALSSRLQSKYRWGIRKDAKLPTGFVFLKRKKQFLKGRTLISYFRSYYAVLMQVTAQTIDSMCVQLWPQTFGQLSVPNIWRAIHEHSGLWREAVFKVFCAICFFAASRIPYKQFLTQKKQVSYPKCI